ncbi:MAG: DNA-processing protein DprA [Thermodesulfobacteriota bacterium]|nr:DNA-processing protein DprA [Thermodesulfobacteriota bacterium]
MIRNDNAFYILRLLETPGLGVVKTNAIVESVGPDLDPNRLQRLLGEKQLEGFLSNETRVLSNWELLEKHGVKCLTILDDRYPERLKKRLKRKAPPLLMVMGNQNLLDATTVGFCGSRKASDKGIATARDCADQLAGKGINIASGYAAGVDMATHRAALECGGTTTLVLCEGILHFRKKRALKDIWDWERIAVVSEFLPGVPWTVRNAMQRNSTISGLASAMILIESASKGGSIAAGRTCIEMGIPLFAPVYEGMPETAVGNRELLGQGAQELYKNSRTNRANMTNVLAAIERQETKASQETHLSEYDTADTTSIQLGLFENGGRYGD